jgi:hypothetical protein
MVVAHRGDELGMRLSILSGGVDMNEDEVARLTQIAKSHALSDIKNCVGAVNFVSHLRAKSNHWIELLTSGECHTLCQVLVEHFGGSILAVEWNKYDLENSVDEPTERSYSHMVYEPDMRPSLLDIDILSGIKGLSSFFVNDEVASVKWLESFDDHDEGCADSQGLWGKWEFIQVDVEGLADYLNNFQVGVDADVLFQLRMEIKEWQTLRELALAEDAAHSIPLDSQHPCFTHERDHEEDAGAAQALYRISLN